MFLLTHRRPTNGESKENTANIDAEKSEHRMATVVEGRLAVSMNGKQPLDEDIETLQRLSFVSTSTGYSSARSSLRSSEIGDEAPSLQTRDLSIERRLLTRESSLSEPRRQKLLKSGTATQLDRIAIELLETERCYVNDLNDIIQGYLNFFIDHREEFQMTVSDVSSTFGCIERIFIFNRHLYHQLDAALLNVVLMAKCFIDSAEGFKDYITYCTNFQKMVETLNNLMKNNTIAETLTIRQSILGHSLPLSAYLLKPVQRVLKYHLFMENILKHSGETPNLSDSDRALIADALECMTAQAEKINEEKKRVEHWERVKELQNALHRWCSEGSEDLSKYGDLLLEGTFKLAGSKTNRQLFLFEEMLMIVKERNGALICKDYIMCSSIMLNESVSADPLAFQVLAFDNPKIQYVFLSSNIDQKRQWMKELKRMMLDHYNVEIPEKTKMLMLNMDTTSMKPFAISTDREDIVSNSKGARRIPKYLEKRRKSVDTNGVVRRPQRKERSNSRTRSVSRVSKASSTGSLIPVLSTVNIGLTPKEVTTCTCSTESDATPSTSGVGPKITVSHTPSSGSETSGIVDHSKASSSLSTLFSRHKLLENSRSKLFNARKKSALLPPTPHHTHEKNDHSNHTSGNICLKTKDCALNRCTCNDAISSIDRASFDLRSPTRETSTSLIGNPPSAEHIENTFAELYKELNLLMSSPEWTEESKPATLLARKRSCEMRQQAATTRLDAVVNGTHTNGEEGCDGEKRCRSKSLGKLDEMLSAPSVDSALAAAVADESTDAFVVEPPESNSEVFINGSSFVKMLDEKMRGCQSESEGDEEVPAGVNWTESPSVRNSGLLHSANIHHRRRSSQVAEQVWRLRHKNANSRNTENCVDAKCLSSYSTPETIPLRVTVTEYQTRKVSAPTAISPPYVKLSSTDRRLSMGMQLARQRTPLTVEQCAQLDDVLLDPSLGVVKEMVKQIEKPPSRCILTSTPKLLS
uniref:Pleckstrin homology domain-containing family G member 1 n=1 Tax=Parascaris univalens TaxID=6257 RepID=A0A915B409_PARUN